MHLLKDKLALGTVAACALLLLLPACSTRGDAPDPMHVDLMSDTPKEVPPPSPPPPDIKSLQEQSDTASVTKGDDTTPGGLQVRLEALHEAALSYGARGGLGFPHFRNSAPFSGI